MAHLDASDFLDGSDVDEDNGGVVDQDVENVLLGSDDDEVTTPHHHQAGPSSRGNKFSYTDGGRRNSEEEEDVLDLALAGDEEPLDFDADAGQEGRGRVPPISEHEGDLRERLPSKSNYDDNIASNENFNDRRYVEEDEYEDGDDEEEDRTTRSRFTSERSRNVESYGGGHMGGSSSSVGIPIQTVGDRKGPRPGIPEGRNKPWTHHGGPRHMGPRYQGGRNQRFPHPPRPGSNDNPHLRGNQPIVQFNEGLFTDFNQPMRHPHPRNRQPPPGHFDGPRHPEMGPHHRHPMHPQDPNVRHFGPRNNRPFFPPNDNRFGPSRMPPPPGNMIHPQHQSPPVQPRPDFNLRGPRPPRFSPNNFNQRGPRPPPQAMNSHPNPQMERPPFPPRQQHPNYNDVPPPRDMGNNNRPPNMQGFHQPPHGGPPGFTHPNMNPPPPRYIGPPRPPGEPHHTHMPFYNQEQVPNFHPGLEPPPPTFHHEAQWSGAAEPVPNQTPWMQQQQPQQNYGGQGYASNMYDQTARPATSAVVYSSPQIMHQGNHPQMSLTLHTSHHQMEIPQITKSIYIKPNSEIHEALSKGQFRHHMKEDDRRYHESGTPSSSSSRHYDDHYRDRDRDHRDRPSSSSRRESSPSERRRDDDYHDHERRSYQKYEEKRQRRKYEDDRRHRSESPERKTSRTERPMDSNDRKREREAEKERVAEKKEADKLLEEAKKMGLGEDYVKKLEEQRKLRERILKTKEQRRKQVKVPTDGEDGKSAQAKDPSRLTPGGSRTSASSQKGTMENVKEIEADSTVATAKSGKPKKILRIVRDKSGKIISKKVHVVLVAKPQQEGQQSTSSS